MVRWARSRLADQVIRLSAQATRNGWPGVRVNHVGSAQIHLPQYPERAPVKALLLQRRALLLCVCASSAGSCVQSANGEPPMAKGFPSSTPVPQWRAAACELKITLRRASVTSRSKKCDDAQQANAPAIAHVALQDTTYAPIAAARGGEGGRHFRLAPPPGRPSLACIVAGSRSPTEIQWQPPLGRGTAFNERQKRALLI